MFFATLIYSNKELSDTMIKVMYMKNIIINIFIPFLCLLYLFFLVINIESITNKGVELIDKNPDIILQPINEYAKNTEFKLIQNVTDFTPYSIQDLKNIFYTIVNNGWNDFTFYCPTEYQNCLNDMTILSKNRDLLTHINNYVHPFNGFSNVQTVLSEAGDITISIEYFYQTEQIKPILEKVDSIYQEIITEDMDISTKILTIHDYIINNTQYDVTRNNHKESKYQSHSAYGPLLEGYATCNGYTDAMAIFLTKMNIPNFKIATTPSQENSVGHVWNAVYINNEWLHLDLTWDDPVSTDGKDYLQHKYFLINSSQLEEADKGEVVVTEHKFKDNIYLEFNKEA